MSGECWAPTKIGDFAWEPTERATPDAEVLSVTKHRGFVPSLEYFGKQVFSKDTDNYKLVRKGQFAYATIHLDEGSIDCLRIREQGIISPMYTVFDVDERRVNRVFLLELLRTPVMLERYAAVGQGSINRRKSIGFEVLASEIVFLPPLPEQKKIAAILSSVDEAIQATQRVIDQTRRVKEGLLQDLLTRGLPGHHTRFKQTEIGEIPEEWEVILLDSVAQRGSGHTPDKKHSEYWGGNIWWVSLADSHRLDAVYLSETTSKITPLGVENSSAVLHPVGTVFVSRDASVGRSAIAAVPLAVSQHFIAWRCGSRLNNHFLYYCLQHHKRRFEQIAAGSTIKTIGLGYFKAFRISLPPLREQQDIAARLFALDQAMWCYEGHCEHVKRVKAGLLQGLLTGKVRVIP